MVKKEFVAHFGRLFKHNIYIKFYNIDEEEDKLLFLNIKNSPNVAIFHGKYMIYVASPSAKICQEIYTLAKRETGLFPVITDRI